MTSIVNNVVNYFHPMNSLHILGQDKEILKIGSVLNSLFINKKNINIPKLVVVGTQSSGKSSILNSIIGMDILPTGSNMVTRGPLQLELIQSNKNTYAVFGNYDNGLWINGKQLDIQYPNPTIEQKQFIYNTITTLTRQYAGNQMNITNIPIYLRIYSPNIPYLTLTDLPGLTMVACTDKGQPKDIKDRIRNLVATYIKNTESIIMAVIPARTDIEIDIALDLIKEYDYEGDRTIGILTKVDLMNEGTNIGNYLENKISKDLQLKYNYYAIKNRNNIEMSSMNVTEGLKKEQEFFHNHRIYSNFKYKDNIGIPALCKNLSCILIKALKRELPNILDTINKDLLKNETEFKKLGTPIPSVDTLKSAFIHKTIAKLNRKYISILEDRGKNIHTGKHIKTIFHSFRKDLDKLQPFSNINCSDVYIKNIISNCEGNHMSFPSPPVEVLEQMIKDTTKRPIHLILEPAQKCSQKILNELIELIEILVKELSIDRFPNLSKLIFSTTMNEVLLPSINNLYKYLKDEILCQENYIWTDNNAFLKILDVSKNSNTSIMRNLAQSYYKSITYVLQDIIPKKIMYYLVIHSQKELSNKLYENVKKEQMDFLLMEYDEIEQKRNQLLKNIQELSNGKKLIEDIL